MEIVEAGLQVLENEVIAPVTIESIRLMKNGIRSIEEDAFRYANHVPGMQVTTTTSKKHPKICAGQNVLYSNIYYVLKTDSTFFDTFKFEF